MAKELLGRLAMREEGDWWVAYCAKPDTMDGALELGRVKMNIARLPGQKEAGLAYFRAAFSAMVKRVTGADALWPNPPTPAPEHERSGRA